MNETIQLGYKNRLLINRQTDNGFYLCSKDLQEVLLPKSYISSDMNIGDEVDVFVYTDSEDRLVAVTKMPKAKVGEFGYFEVVDIAPFGAFVDWGLPKDLLVPKSMQKIPFKKGMKTVLRVCIDDKSNTIIANHKYANYLSKDINGLEKNQQVKFIVYKKTDLGYKVIVNDLYDALLFHSDVFEHISVGDVKIGYIKNLREDGKIDITLKPIGQGSVDNDTKKVLDILYLNGGKMGFTYKSSPQEIQNTFGLSRKSFKKALTYLIENKLIELSDEGMKKV